MFESGVPSARFLCDGEDPSCLHNHEYVIPQWLLAKHCLHSKKINLPNGGRLSYGQYTLPCCVECNFLMGEKIETPTSRLIAGGLSSVGEYLETEGHWLFFIWLALIYLKTHLKDRQLRFHLDRRLGADPISDFYDWAEMHHIHCMARAFFTGAQILEFLALLGH